MASARASGTRHRGRPRVPLRACRRARSSLRSAGGIRRCTTAASSCRNRMRRWRPGIRRRASRGRRRTTRRPCRSWSRSGRLACGYRAWARRFPFEVGVARISRYWSPVRRRVEDSGRKTAAHHAPPCRSAKLGAALHRLGHPLDGHVLAVVGCYCLQPALLLEEVGLLRQRLGRGAVRAAAEPGRRRLLFQAGKSVQGHR